MDKINSLKDLLKAREFGEKTIEDISHNCYKYTDCGASCQLTESGIRLGSIIEGVDGDGVTFTLDYPFTIKEFWETLDTVESQAHDIWMETHGCEQCDAGEGEYGMPVVNPECKGCEGRGIVI